MAKKNWMQRPFLDYDAHFAHKKSKMAVNTKRDETKKAIFETMRRPGPHHAAQLLLEAPKRVMRWLLGGLQLRLALAAAMRPLPGAQLLLGRQTGRSKRGSKGNRISAGRRRFEKTVKSAVFSPIHTRTEGRAKLWGSLFTTKVASQQGG
jgi:hypothetical protein